MGKLQNRGKAELYGCLLSVHIIPPCCTSAEAPTESMAVLSTRKLTNTKLVDDSSCINAHKQALRENT